MPTSEQNYFVYEDIYKNVEKMKQNKEKHLKKYQRDYFIKKILELLDIAENNDISRAEILQTVLADDKNKVYKIKLLSKISNSTIIQRRRNKVVNRISSV